MHQTIINKIKELRKSKNLDYFDMAEMLHINKTAYYRLESGHTFTWAKYLKDILKILEISEIDFLNEILYELKKYYL